MRWISLTLVHTAFNGTVEQRVNNRNDEMFGKVAAKRAYSPGQLLNLKLEVFPGGITIAEDREVCLTKRFFHNLDLPVTEMEKFCLRHVNPGGPKDIHQEISDIEWESPNVGDGQPQTGEGGDEPGGPPAPL